MKQLLTLRQLGHYLGAPIDDDRQIQGFSVDTRTLQPGEIYCALPGSKVDGHAFVREAFQKGALAALVAPSYNDAGLLLPVPDVLKALQELAKKRFSESRPRHVIAVTGSLGKTTTKEFIATLLSGKYHVFKTPGNSNTKISLPQTLLNLYGNEDVAVVEMGMTHPGQISKLLEIAPPDIAVLTKVALVHAENFTSIAEIAEAKTEIFLDSRTRLGIYAAEIDTFYPVSTRGTCIKKRFAEDDLQKELEVQIGRFTWNPELGAHNIHNALAAIAVAKALDVTVDEIRERLKFLELPEKRFQKVEKCGVTFINDSYNAAADSVKAALRGLPDPAKGGKKIAVLGSMMELGKFSEECHLKIGEEALLTLDHLICYGVEYQPAVELWKSQGRKVDHFSEHEAIVTQLRNLARPGDVVLLKGSKSKMLWKILEAFSL